MKIVVDDNIPYARELFGQFGDVKLLSGRDISSELLQEVDALIVRSVTKVDAELLSKSKVKFVGTVTSGIDHVDKDYLSSASIVFSSAVGSNSVAVAEYVFSVLLLLAKRNDFFLCDKVVGIIGVGNIGSYLYKKLDFFGVPTLLCDPVLERNNNFMCFCSLEKLVSEADILTFHVPLIFNNVHSTWHMVGIDFLKELRDDIILINTSRGSIIDNIALLNVLKSGKKLHVVLDVWENEPNLSFELLKYIDFGTPHVAGSTLEGKIRGIVQVFNDYKVFLGINVSENSMLFHFPFSPVHCFEINEDVNQEILFCLSKFIYDVTVDDRMLRCSIGIPGIFDILRRCYRNRREWSSICIACFDVFLSEKFRNLGFSIGGKNSYNRG